MSFPDASPGAHARPFPAPYACHPAQSRGRLHKEPESDTRSVFQRDRDRIIHCAAFRRLEYKTQVFVNHEGDHYRTRLTHSLEVSQLARSLCRALGLNEDLAEALALAHDLGHPPFGHAGEDALREAMQPFGGFDHNAQAIRILTSLEQRYAGFDGLNLTWETLEGVAKHNGPPPGGRALPFGLAEYAARHDLELDSWPGLEAQIVPLADDIAYNNHDMEDGIRAGLFSLEDLGELPLIGDILREVDAAYGALEPPRRVHEAIRRAVNRMVKDALEETARNLREGGVESAEDARLLGRPAAAFSTAMQAHHRALKAFLMERMYRHHRVNRMSSKARRMVGALFAFFHAEPECLPAAWRARADGPGTSITARVVCDFIAGMTDRFAMDEYRRVFDPAERT